MSFKSSVSLSYKLKFNIISRALFLFVFNFIGMKKNNLDYVKFASRAVLGIPWSFVSLVIEF